MARKKIKEEDFYTPEEVAEPVETNPLKDRQTFLLSLIDTMKSNGFKDMSAIEVELSRVNKALE